MDQTRIPSFSRCWLYLHPPNFPIEKFPGNFNQISNNEDFGEDIETLFDDQNYLEENIYSNHDHYYHNENEINEDYLNLRDNNSIDKIGQLINNNQINCFKGFNNNNNQNNTINSTINNTLNSINKKNLNNNLNNNSHNNNNSQNNHNKNHLKNQHISNQINNAKLNNRNNENNKIKENSSTRAKPIDSLSRPVRKRRLPEYYDGFIINKKNCF